MNWLDKALEITATGGRCVLVTIVEVHGSAPREPGAKMLVHADGIIGSIGGGSLEYRAIEAACLMLANPGDERISLQRFALGPGLRQCCGGQVRVSFERLSGDSERLLRQWAGIADQPHVVVTDLSWHAARKTLMRTDAAEINELPFTVRQAVRTHLARRRPPRLIELSSGDAYLVECVRPESHPLYLFGAGHVGKAIVRAVGPLPFQITWIDSRDRIFPDDLPCNVQAVHCAAPQAEVDRAPPGTLFLVMTHSHPLDLEICARVLRRDDFDYLGLIGSETKRARFAGRLRAIGITPQALGRLTCPIGIPGIASKDPAAIAASVAAQLLIVAERQQHTQREMSATALGTG
jgi:xanthine dehydrogenase accessory factor